MAVRASYDSSGASPSGLTKDQRKRKAGKSRYFWRDRDGQWHYHVEGKTTTDRVIPKKSVFKNKGKKSDSTGDKQVQHHAPSSLETTVSTRKQSLNSLGSGQSVSTNAINKPKALVETVTSKPSKQRRENALKTSVGNRRGLGGNSRTKEGVSTKVYDRAASQMVKRRRKGYRP